MSPTATDEAGTWLQKPWSPSWRRTIGLLTFLLLGMVFHRSVEFSHLKPLWFDELFTQNLADQPTWHLFRSGLVADGNPPLFSAVARLLRLAGVSVPWAVRLPSMLAYVGSAPLLYQFVSRRLGSVIAAMAVLLVCTNGAVFFYSAEARPYAFVLFFSALALVSWQAATDPIHRSRTARWLLCSAIAGAVLSQHLAIFSVGLPILAGEVTRTIRRRTFDWPLIATACLGLLPVVFTLPLIRATQRELLAYSKYPHGVPHSLPLADYTSLLPHQGHWLVLILSLTSCCFFLRNRMRRIKVGGAQPGWTAPEFAAILASTMSLFVVFVLMNWTSGYYAGMRYGIGSILGISCLFVTPLVWLPEWVQLSLWALIAFPLVRAEPRMWLRPAHSVPSAEILCVRSLPSVPVVFVQALAFPAAEFYANASERQHIYFLSDKVYAQQRLYNTPELAMIAQLPIYPENLVDYRAFLQTHPTFLTVGRGLPVQEYPLTRLEQDGVTFSPVQSQVCQANGLLVHRAEVPQPN